MFCISLNADDVAFGIDVVRAFIIGPPPGQFGYDWAYGKSTFFFLEPSMTSTLGRAGAGGATGVTFAAVLDAEIRGRGRRETVGVAGLLSLLPMPGSGTGMARSPERSVLLFAPGVVSSPWSTELRITSCSRPSLDARASFSACSGVT